MIKTSRRKNKGFGLIEVLVSTVILGVGLVGVAKFQGDVYKGGSLSSQRAEALKIAEKKLEELRHFSTISQYETNITSSLSGIQNVTNTTINSDTTTFTLKAYVKPDATGKSADISVAVTWPDLTNNGSVTPETTVQLSTVISNNTPNSLALTTIPGFAIPPSADNPDVPDILIEIVPTDSTLNSSNPFSCLCSTTTVTETVTSGMMGSTTTTTDTNTVSNPNRSQECDFCCGQVGGAWASADIDSGYAQFAKALDIYFQKKNARYAKVHLQDQVIDQTQFDSAFLFKGYQKQNNAFDYFLKKTGMGSSSTTTTTVTDNYALCSYTQETVTSSTTTTNISRRYRGMMGSWSETQ